jgi:hypothetical protein
MMNDNDLKQIFKASRNEIPDNGFTEKLKKRLPPRPSFAPQILMSICVMAGLLFIFMIQDVNTFAYNIFEFVSSLSQLQPPSFVSLVS